MLRKFVPEDAAAVFTQSNEDAARTWLPSQVYRDQAHALSVLEFLIGQYSSPGNPKEGPFVLAIQHRVDSVLIGHVGFSPLDDEVEVGYAIAQEYQGRGFGTEAVAAASRWALQTFGLDQILGIASAANIASKRVLTHAGFAFQRDETRNNQGAEQVTSVYVLSK